MAQGTQARSWALVRTRVAWSGETRIRPPLRGDGASERADDVAVDPLQGLDLGVGPPFVAGLVGGLDVDADDVVVVQGRDARPALGRVIGVEIAGRPLDVDPVPPREHPDPSDQVDGRDDRPLQAVEHLELGQSRGLPLTPEPDRVGGGLPSGQPIAG